MKYLSFLPTLLLTLGAGTNVLAHEDEANIPADTYFSIAVTENSHNHYGENLLYLDFQEHPNTSKIAPRIVISPRIEPGGITIDGKSNDIHDQSNANFYKKRYQKLPHNLLET